MDIQIAKRVVLTAVGVVAIYSGTEASLIYTYDFPGTPGSGLAVDQTNPQPPNATFSDFTRTNLNPDTVLRPNEFDTIGWAHNGQDTTQHEGFTITAHPGYLLDLSSLTFNAFQYASGATQGQVALFLNGSASAYASLDFHWDVNGPVTFNFTPLTITDNVTVAEFRFYGWTAGSPNGGDGLSAVAVFGDVVVPEVSSLGPIVLLLAGMLLRGSLDSELLRNIRNKSV
jgi:hypothetical protein